MAAELALRGTGAVPGIAIGELGYFARVKNTCEKRLVLDIETELRRFEAAAAAAADQLMDLHEEARAKVGDEHAQIFEIHAMMLEDEDFRTCVADAIRKEGVCAEYAVAQASRVFADSLRSSGTDYIGERANDVADIAGRLISILRGYEDTAGLPDHPVILAADDLTPSETVRLDRNRVLGFAISAGSVNSHTAILARSMGIPAVVGVGAADWEALSGQTAILDGASGTVVVSPDDAELAAYRKRAESERAETARLETLRDQETVTSDGRRVDLFANIGDPAEIDAALASGAEGIGLFRSEFLFLGRDSLPSEEEQFEAYRTAVTRMTPRKVIIRTLDIGADKKLDCLGIAEEANPALGLRAIRLCLARPELFKTQLRALLRASAYGALGIMFPMISSVAEVAAAKGFLAEAKRELDDRGTAYAKDIEVGIMIETPAAALDSEALSGVSDFFSIGTNDLTQYTLAADRENAAVADLYDCAHPAVMSLIRMTAENAHKRGIWVGVCGEAAADTELTETFLTMGIDELSVAPPAVLRVRDRIRSVTAGG